MRHFNFIILRIFERLQLLLCELYSLSLLLSLSLSSARSCLYDGVVWCYRTRAYIKVGRRTIELKSQRSASERESARGIPADVLCFPFNGENTKENQPHRERERELSLKDIRAMCLSFFHLQRIHSSNTLAFLRVVFPQAHTTNTK